MDGPEPREVVKRIRREFEASRGSRIWPEYIRALNLISQVVFTRSAGFILELIQNAEDAGRGLSEPGSLEISVSPERVKITHNGRPFCERDAEALCGIRSSKKPEQGTLGYLGIGFKSVFKITDCPEVYSGGYRFKFDKHDPAWAEDPGAMPWHVTPIWLDSPSEGVDPALTTFILPFRESGAYQDLVDELRRLDTGLFLFLRWLKNVRMANEETVGQIVDEAKALGLDYVVSGGGPPNYADAAAIQEIAEKFATAAALLEPHGLKFGIHNHWWEFDHDVDDQCPDDLMMAQAGKAFAQVDICWAAFGGHDPAAVITRNAGRVDLIHVKAVVPSYLVPFQPPG